ncbi:S41 family peptidase [Corallococcus sp. bb12-1]|uniref:S41 family peptidase n=1 Tax=Corallococcus sp. bb12-1 TaxID=2996784 RepID=UPI00226E26E4|nr:S41 family peptidase [Corallococcus sp. bb12-1]MCY1044400.1 S41 family peptidase [Corallococcus sp. bb12-1]
MSLRLLALSCSALLLMVPSLGVAEPPAPVVTPYAPVTLDAVKARADVALLRRALETIHPGLYRYRSRADLQAAFARLEAAASRPTTDLALWRALALMLAELHCDHTKPEPSVALEAFRRTHPTHLPLRFKLIEGRMIVVSNDGQSGAPPPGSELVGINGLPVPRVLTELGRAVAYDGSTDHAIAAKLGSDSDLMGDDFNEYWPAFHGFPTKWNLDWKRSGELRLSHSVLEPVPFKQWTALPWPGSPYRDEFYKALHWRIDGKRALLRIDTFVNYRNPVDATTFLGSFFKTLKAQGVEQLILDLRESGGGSEDVSVALSRYLLKEPFLWSKPSLLKAIRYGDLPSHIESWGDRKAVFEPDEKGFRRTSDGWWERLPRPDDEGLRMQDVSPDRFTGTVTVLSGPMNGSGTTRTLAQLKEKLGARLLGEESAGSAEGPTAGRIFLLTLPHSGLRVRIPNAWNRTTIEHFVPGRGVPVDETVIPTVADFDAGRDRAVEVAKEKGTAVVPGLAAVLTGSWRGTLDYRDFQSDRRVVLPTMLEAAGDGDEVRFAFTFDDGPGKTVRSTESWRLGAGGGTLITGDGAEMKIMERRGGGEATELTLVAEGRGQENTLPVEVRTVLTRRGAVLTISRLTRRPGEPFLLRHVYRLSAGREE